MATVAEELNCSICLSLYTEPVSLRCGHNFCRGCIEAVLTTQDGTGVYSCPECREEYSQRPLLEKNRKLSNIVESFSSTEPEQKTEIYCTYCVDSLVLASKTCLQCETSMCEKHLKAHNRSVDHVLIEPTKSFADIKCPTHKEIIKYYCAKDGVCICMSCWVAGDHVGHKMELLNDATEKKKVELKASSEKLNSDKHETQKRIQNLANHRTQEKGKAATITGRITELFGEMRKQLDEEEKRVLAAVTRQEQKISRSVSNFIGELEKQKDRLSNCIHEVEEVSEITDQITFLKTKLKRDHSIIGGDIMSDVKDVGGLDETMISLTLHLGIYNFIDRLTELKKNTKISGVENLDVSLDANTASNILVSQDLRSATFHPSFVRSRLPERFKSKVLGNCLISSGRIYWKVDVGKAQEWLIGVATQAIPKRGAFTEKMWGLQFLEKLTAIHNNTQETISSDSTMQTVGIYLDYEAGRLSFYQLGDPIRHLHTFTATFTEPLHAVFALNENSQITIKNKTLNYRNTFTCIPGLSSPARQLLLCVRSFCTMASADLREELNCSICLSLYTEPVSLRCGHSFCRGCLVTVLDTQEGTGVYSCPECREEYPQRPLLEKNRKLSNIVESFRSTIQENLGSTIQEVLCTYCDAPTPAAKSCLHCEASFCNKHLRSHSKSAEHILTEPTVTFEDRKCSLHKEILKYYCTEDDACICMSCWVAGDHKGHQVELLDEAAEKKKVKLRDVTGKLISEREKTERRIQNLASYRTQEKGKAAAVTGRVTELFGDIRRKLDDVEKRVLTEVTRQEELMSESVSDLTQQLDTQKVELSRKLLQMEGLCKITDPVTVLKKEHNSDLIMPKTSDIISDVRDAGGVDEGMISQVLHRGLFHFADSLTDMKIKRQFPVMEKSDISLDINTANNYIIISQDFRSATYTDTPQTRPDGPERFRSCQVFSTQSFSSGRHYWEVDVSRAKKWLIGVANHSIERKVDGNESHIGYNDKSWGLSQREKLSAVHNNIHKFIDSAASIKAVGIYLDYEAGRLSFYQLCDPIRHLYTFTATFTEPLHAAFFVFKDSSIRIIQ
ncbi:uncharacterized protein [Hyperolius riggenbachi]|uniref:uncharacterized protein n=1 Tax=Hyperolius riggenbachi TaxID=752182 RepID=UPI0035A3A290